MSLVSLGSCLFTINSAFAFLNGPMEWDASRISAAIPSGVGFLGAGLIFKKQEKTKFGDGNPVVHGLTTAASLWISAAVGIACGGDLYMPASFGVALMMLLLRFGPRGHEDEDVTYGGDDEELLDTKEMDVENDDTTAKNAGQSADFLDMESPRNGDEGRSSVPNYASIQSTSMHDETVSLTSSVRGGTSTRNVSGESGATAASAPSRASMRKRQAALGSLV